MNWLRGLKVKVKRNVALRDKTTFKIGGKAKFYAEPANIEELRQLLISAEKENIPVYILGAGSNLLVSDKGVRGLVIRLCSPAFRKLSFSKSRVSAGSGVLLGQLLRKALGRGLSGIEFLAGIPASVGGALAMNAGAWGSSIGKYVEEVSVMDYNGKVNILKKRALRFSYRSSNLKDYIILAAVLNLRAKDKNQIQRAIKDYLHKKLASQEARFPSAGCVFQNPGPDSAGKLIDLCGLKGKSKGGAAISPKHANFIINKSRASARQVLWLVARARDAVKRKFGYELKPEITIWK
jgi:UDP-N-acetylmuramate dehydrogenase